MSAWSVRTPPGFRRTDPAATALAGERVTAGHVAACHAPVVPATETDRFANRDSREETRDRKTG